MTEEARLKRLIWLNSVKLIFSIALLVLAYWILCWYVPGTIFRHDPEQSMLVFTMHTVFVLGAWKGIGDGITNRKNKEK